MGLEARQAQKVFVWWSGICREICKWDLTSWAKELLIESVLVTLHTEMAKPRHETFVVEYVMQAPNHSEHVVIDAYSQHSKP